MKNPLSASQTPDLGEPVPNAQPAKNGISAHMPTGGRVLAFAGTAAFFAVFGLPWLWFCRWDVREWRNDAKTMYRKLAGIP